MNCHTPLQGGQMNRGDVVSALKRALVLTSLTALAACTTVPKPAVDAVVPAPAVVSMEEWLSRGDNAAKDNDHAKARDAWRSAARDYPTAKQPWLKLSEDYFNAADYGNAVLAAQEALQRDPRDRLANSVLAVSGLRLTAGSLAALRDGGTYPVGSRNEAVSVTRALREALGEPLLVSPEPAKPRRSVRPAQGTPTSGSASPSAANDAAPAPPPGNPLNKLK